MKRISDRHGIATPRSMEEYMSKAHLPRLTVQPDGTVLISTPDDLDQLSACPIHDLSTEMLMFVDREWLERSEEERASIAAFLNAAREQLCNEGRLPPPRTDLPLVGVRVEVIHGGKPNPERRWAVGTVTSHEWCSVTRDWRLGVTFDQANGSWYGQPIRGATTIPRFIYVVGDPTRRAWSSMAPDEIKAFIEITARSEIN